MHGAAIPVSICSGKIHDGAIYFPFCDRHHEVVLEPNLWPSTNIAWYERFLLALRNPKWD